MATKKVIKGVRQKISTQNGGTTFGSMISFSANAADIFFPKRLGEQDEDSTLQGKINGMQDEYRNEFQNISPSTSKVPEAIVTTTGAYSSTSTVYVGISNKYAPQDHKHQLTIETGDDAGQIKIGGKNVDVKGWQQFGTNSYGLVPPGGGSENAAKFLRGDGTWGYPPGMGGATAASAGATGLVPQPQKGDQNKYLQGNGQWSVPQDTTYDLVTTADNGLVRKPTTAQANVNYILAGDNTWVSKPTNWTTFHWSTETSKTVSGVVKGPSSDKANANYILAGNNTWIAKPVYDLASTAAHGLVRKPTSAQANANYILAGNNTWIAKPANWAAFGQGTSGVVKAPNSATANANYILAGNNSWVAKPADWPYFSQGKGGTVKAPDSATANANYVLAGNNTWISKPNHWTAFAQGRSGVVNAPNATQASTGYVLAGNNTWVVKPPTYKSFGGATNSRAGAEGLVPQPKAGDQAKLLRGDGTWVAPVGVNSRDNDGYVTKGTGNPDRFWTTDSNGVPGWRLITSIAKVFSGPTSVANGTAGLVPAPSKTWESRANTVFLGGDGSWHDFLFRSGTATPTSDTCPTSYVYFKL